MRFLLLQVVDPHYHQELALANMLELEQLVSTYGGEVVLKSVQHRVKPHTNTYIGPGKVDWLLKEVTDLRIDVVVLNSIVNSGQLFRLEKILWAVNTRIQVWDRIDLILNIFDQHATTTEAKLQIELAKIEHMGPRIYGLGKTVLSRQGGGIGTKGIGETNIEIERRNLKKRRQKVQHALAHRSQIQAEQLQQRRERGIITVALVGYTSAGKTTLFNALTTKTKQTHQGLFTTLDSVVGKFENVPVVKRVLISDTIGFIDDLPPALIEAFKSTLTESLTAQVVLEVIDASDERLFEKKNTVESILHDLGVTHRPVYVFNKIDQLSDAQLHALKMKYGSQTNFYISAKTGVGLKELKHFIKQTAEKIQV